MNKIIPSPSPRTALPLSRSAKGAACIVTSELEGPDFNGGIGTTNRALAMVLRDEGYDVDILYMRVNDGAPYSHRGSFREQVNAFRHAGIRLMCIENNGAWNDWAAKSHKCLLHLLKHQYAIVFFDDTHGTGYYPLLAKRTGNPHLRNTVMCVTTHSATQWIFDMNQMAPVTYPELRLMEMERRSIELADVVKAPSAYILEKYRSYGWAVPDDAVVLPNFTSPEDKVPVQRTGIPIKELVFFGRLERRKGLWMFCRALDRLKYRLVDVPVTFLGRPTIEDGALTSDVLVRRSASWPFKIRLLTKFNRDQALSYLERESRLAIIASPEDNSPSAILECLDGGIPFIACSGGGGAELMDENTRAANLCAPTSEDLAAKLLSVLEQGGSTGRKSFENQALRHSYTEWLSRLVKPLRKTAKPAAGSDLKDKPVVIVIVPGEYRCDGAAAELCSLARLLDDKIEIEALAEQPEDLRKELRRLNEPGAINVGGVDDFSAVIESFSYRATGPVCICHITQLPGPEWLTRAKHCFANDPQIAGLTGMVGESEPAPVQDRETYYSDHERVTIKEYLSGNARGLFALAVETNSGFAFIRSNIMSLVAGVTITDAQYGRLKRMKDLIHEILVRLHQKGHLFELIPDMTVDREPVERHNEAFSLVQFMRSLPETMFGQEPGSDKRLLTQLGIDIGLGDERALANKSYLTRISENTGVDNVAGMPSLSPENYRRKLAAIAHANGQIDLAMELYARAGVEGGETRGSARDIFDFLAGTVSLSDLVAEGKFRNVNLDENYSFEFDRAGNSIRIHANPANRGRAAIVFPSVDLTGRNTFICDIEKAEKAVPLRFILELRSENGQLAGPYETVIRDERSRIWQIGVPDGLTTCRITLAVELEDLESSSESAFATWNKPRFLKQHEERL